MKHRIVHLLQKYFLNPPIKFLLAIDLAPPGYALLETIGRNTGKPRRTPVGDGRIGSQFWIVAEHGVKAGYVRNIQTNPRVRLKLREGVRARWHNGTAHVARAAAVACGSVAFERGECAGCALTWHATAYGAD